MAEGFDFDYYLDWCPRATNAVGSRAAMEIVGQPQEVTNCLIASRKVGSKDIVPIQRFEFWYRNDGLFIFRVAWKRGSSPDAEAKVQWSYRLSNYIKERLNHVHQFHNGSAHTDRRRNFPSLTIHPIHLHEEAFKVTKDDKVESERSGETSAERPMTADEVRRHIQNPAWLAGLEARTESGSKTSHTALLLLRAKFANIFSKGLQIPKVVREEKIWIIPIYNIRILVVIYAVIIAVVTWIDVFSTFQTPEAPFTSELSTVFSTGDFYQGWLSSFWSYFLARLPFLLALVFILIVSMKRRKILKALHRARGYLTYGNILDQVIADIVRASPHVSANEPQGFQCAIDILDNKIYLERKKRWQTIAWVALFLNVSYIPFVETIPEMLGVVPENVRSSLVDLLGIASRLKH